MNLSHARRHIEQLHHELTELVKRDPEHELPPMALRDLDSLLEIVKTLLPQSELIQQLDPVFSVASAESQTEPLRAVDVLFRVGMLKVELGPEPIRISTAAHRPMPNIWEMGF